MNGRRVGALLIAVLLIAGSWLIRTQVIDGGSSSSGTPSTTAVFCITDLADTCRSALGGRADITLTVESVNSTLDRLGSATSVDDIVWITTQPFPQMVTELRTGARLPDLPADVTGLASSPLILAVEADRAGILTTKCREPVVWKCLGEIAGQPWRDIDPGADAGTVRPAFAAHPGTAVGQLGIAAAVRGYFGSGPIDGGDASFIVWTKMMKGATDTNALGGLTAIERMQTRASFADIAVGADRELNPDSAAYVALASQTPVGVDVVAAAFGNASLSSDARAVFLAAFTEGGWGTPRTSDTPSATDMLTIRTLWSD